MTDLNEDEKQAILLGLALVSFQRPGWQHYLSEISSKFGDRGREIYESLRRIHSPEKLGDRGKEIYESLEKLC